MSDFSANNALCRCVKGSLLPQPTGAIASSSWTFCTQPLEAGARKPNFGESFRLAVPAARIGSKTLQITVWSVADGYEDCCLGSAQVSLADFDANKVSTKWYNVLSFKFMQQQPKKKKSSKDGGSSLTSGSRQGTLKEGESSDESTIISSQASTLTRNEDAAAAVAGAAAGSDMAWGAHGEAEESEEDEEDDDDEVEIPTLPEVLESLDAIRRSGWEDKETNTECVFSPSLASSVVKRSQTFSPSAAPVDKSDYVCKLNRSDSDSAMSAGGKAFKKSALERRSLRLPMNGPTAFPAVAMASMAQAKMASAGHGGARRKVKGSKPPPAPRTSLDLELDLAAQQTKYRLMREEIERLRQIKAKLEEARKKGVKELPTWLQEHERFHQLLAKVR